MKWSQADGEVIVNHLFRAEANPVIREVIIENKLLVGSAGIGAEVGHMLICEHSPIRCGCGNYGCLESLISGLSLAEQARQGLV